MPFEAWNVGEELFSSLDKEHDLLDRDLRPFAEEADHMQGIQMIAEVDDAWGGFAARYIDRIRDEYGKTAITFWGVEDGLTTIPRVSYFMLGTRITTSDKSTGKALLEAIKCGQIDCRDISTSISLRPYDCTVSEAAKLCINRSKITMAFICTPCYSSGEHEPTFTIEVA